MTVEYKTIVVPADGSENSKRALQHAVSIAERNKAQLVVVHVANIVSAISNFDQTPISGGYVSEQIAEDMEETGKEILNDVVKEVPADVTVKSVFEVGSPGPAVLAVAKKFNADLIVMGSRGLGPLKGLFMGSVSSYVTSHSTCPVLVVK
ncbi:universal stress protein [Veillonella magna]|uniref:Universal stress protein n=1 Tax=Veillonella magna TaxID=464322 RepID=A0ABS2GG25_9FIRM|nr:universal stress protein [Veillonella magna]MBD8976351.1 universal stress protein [Veillonella magna]MBM6824070.1 universal stress protein [Veillonella magna]MBM6912363.1 universal stress protein [Veillonella magna]